jgi:hypothetical protein
VSSGGNTFRIQIIETKKLSAEENLWLKCLGNDLDIYRAKSRVVRKPQFPNNFPEKIENLPPCAANSAVPAVYDGVGMERSAMTYPLHSAQAGAWRATEPPAGGEA